jgi:predicted DNA-binding transcriptional regulator AlpA
MERPSRAIQVSKYVLFAAQDLRSSCAPAALTGISVATWYRLLAAKRVPAPFKLGRLTLWRLAEIRAWNDAGCPDRQTWEALCAVSTTVIVQAVKRNMGWFPTDFMFQLSALVDLAHKLDALEKKYDRLFREVFEAIRLLMEPRRELEEPKRRFGFR